MEPAMEAHLGYWLRLVSNEVSRAFARALHEQGMSVAEWVAMNQLAAGAELTPAKLAATMGMTRGAISKVLDKLDSKKLISRSISSLDSRVQLLSLTERARRILPRLTSVADGNDSHYFAALDSGEKAALRKLLRKLAGLHQMTRIPVG
jgi:DNA-binding MarR family transcriptional regulator